MKNVDNFILCPSFEEETTAHLIRRQNVSADIMHSMRMLAAYASDVHTCCGERNTFDEGWDEFYVG